MVDGHCPFLGDDNLCQIHARYGSDAKPTVCKQFPMVAIRAEEGLRVGIDPACYSAFNTHKDGPLVASGSLISTTTTLKPPQHDFEKRFLNQCEVNGMTLGILAFWLADRPPTSKTHLPEGFEDAVVNRVKEADLAHWIETNPVGRSIQSALMPTLRFTIEDQPSQWDQLEPAAQQWAVEAIRRVIFLRLALSIPTVAGVALLLLSGAVLCGRANPKGSAFAHAYSGWLRAIRFRHFWTRFTPDSATMQRLLHP